jgi:hypothetical protein
VALVRTNISEEHITSTIRVATIDELQILAVTSNRSMLQRSSIVYIVFLCSMLQLLVSANIAPSSLILVTLIIEVIVSPKRQFLQEPHSVTSQKMAVFPVESIIQSKYHEIRYCANLNK